MSCLTLSVQNLSIVPTIEQAAFHGLWGGNRVDHRNFAGLLTILHAVLFSPVHEDKTEFSKWRPGILLRFNCGSPTTFGLCNRINRDAASECGAHLTIGNTWGFRAIFAEIVACPAIRTRACPVGLWRRDDGKTFAFLAMCGIPLHFVEVLPRLKPGFRRTDERRQVS